MFVRDFTKDLEEAIGGCVDDRAYRILTAAVRLLTEKRLMDSSIGFMDICVCGGFVTLPREVETVLAVNVGGQPTLLRNQWFGWHVNGPGDCMSDCGYTTVLGEFCTFRDPDRAVKLAVVTQTAQDNNKKMRVFGRDATGNRIHALNKDGAFTDGFLVPHAFGQVAPNSAIEPIIQIDRIWREPTNAPVELIAIDPTTGEGLTTIARFAPNETTPRYQRIRVEADSWVRIKFRRRDLPITSDEDWVNIDDPRALFLACRTIVKERSDQYGVSAAAEASATRILNDAQHRRNHGGIAPPQILDQSVHGRCDHGDLFY